MKHLLKLSAILIVLVVGLLCLTGTTQAATIVKSGNIGNNLTWVLTDDGTLTISGEGDMEFSNGIVPWYNIRLNITAVVIEPGVTSIGPEAFNGYSNLERVTLADTVTSIKSYAFRNCGSLTDIALPGNLTSIEYAAFSGCSSLVNIALPDTITYLGSSAFSQCTSIASISIPSSVETIDSSAFHDCTGLTEVILCEGVTTIGARAFYGCTGLTSVTIPKSVTQIEEYAFAYCTNLTSIVIPNGKTSLSERAFYCCTGLTTITAPGWCASSVFRDCTNVTSFTVTEGYECDGSSYYHLVFAGFPKLEYVSLPSGVTGLHARTFSNMYSLRSITLSEGLTIINEEVFRGCTGLTSITIPSTVTDMEWDVFNGCTGLTEVIISEGVTDLGINTFWGCTGLTSVKIPGSVTSIGSDVFRACTELTEVTICDGVTAIGSQVFADCTGLKRISIPSSVTVLDSCAFANCNSLESITIPIGVTSLDDAVFYYCENLNSVYFEGNAPQIASDAFYGVTATCYYPAGNTTWTDNVKQDYRGELTWVPCCNEHEMGEWYTAKEVTCTEDGKQQRDCVNCDYFEEKEIPATGHTEVVDEAKEPTCTKPGLTEGCHCSVCNTVIVKQETIPALGHDWEGLTCQRCGEVNMPFTDVKPGKHYYYPVIWAVENGITNGTTPTTFEPNKACTRWQVVTFLWRAAGCPEPTITTHSFTDVSAGNKAVLWAVEQGITSGTTETTFSPDETCNRWQIVTFLWRFAGCPEPTTTGHSFTDVSANNKAVLWAVENGITNGKNATTFAPNDPCTRGQVVTFLYRYMVE